MFLVPIGLDEARVARVPWVSIGILALCTLVHVAGWFGPGDGELQDRFDGLLSYWSERPYLALPEEAERRFGIDEEAREAISAENADARPPRDVEAEQEELDRRWEELVYAHDALPERRFGLVPSRGLAQVGWLTNLFVHGDLFHLLGNMLLFFLVVGPFLEDAWGRPFYLAFYLAGGLAAGLAQALPMGDSPTAIIGASGAISACLGAFALRFAHRKVRLFYWLFLVVRGTFFVPAWGYALFAFALDLLSLGTEGTSAGVAYGAHVGGFLFGLGTAFALRGSGLEARLTPEGVAGPSRTLTGARAAEALQHGDVGIARQGYEAVLRRSPDDAEALEALLRIAAAAFDREGVTRHLERLVARRLTAGDLPGARALLGAHGGLANPGEWRPATAFRAAEALVGLDDALADRFDEGAARASGAVGAKALLRRAGRMRANDPAGALELARRAAELSDLPRELLERARATVLELTPAAAPEPGPPPLAGGDAVRLVPCRLEALRPGSLQLITDAGRPAELPSARVAAVAAGLVAELVERGETLRNRVVLDLLVHPRDGERGRVVIRLVGHGMALGRLFPDVPPQDAFGRVVEGLLAASGAAALPSPEAAAGRPLARFRDLPEFERAVWGRRVSA